MKKFFVSALTLILFFVTGCGESAENFSVAEDKKIPAVEEEIGMKIKICIGDKIFDATLEDNETAREFVKNLPQLKIIHSQSLELAELSSPSKIDLYLHLFRPTVPTKLLKSQKLSNFRC